MKMILETILLLVKMVFLHNPFKAIGLIRKRGVGQVRAL